MAETIKEKDFVEIEFLGRTDGEVFDTNIAPELEKINPQATAKPLIVQVGTEMIVKGFDKDLVGKEIGKKYNVHITQEEGYGPRNPSMIKTIPKRVFTEHKMNPVPGMTVAMDNQLARIVSVSGGRILVDFNNPLSGKELDFEYTIKQKVADEKEKVNCVQDFIFRQRFEFDLDEKKKMVTFKDVSLTPVLNMFKDKFKEMLGYDVEIFQEKKPSEKKEDKKE